MGRFIIISIFFLMLSSCGSNNAKLEAELVEMKKMLVEARKDAEHSAARAIRAQAMAEANAAAAHKAEKKVSELQKELEDCQQK